MSALSPRQMFLLDLACKPIAEAFSAPYLVGTAVQRQDYRDVDVRLILGDDEYDALADAMPQGTRSLAFLGLAVGQYLASLTDLPIDFQFQRQTEANERHCLDSGGTSRNPMGVRSLGNFRGDATPEYPLTAPDKDSEASA